MAQLTDHFSEQELGVEGAEERIHCNAQYLCQNILEKIRAQYSLPVHVTSGYRPELRNEAAHGVSNSEHLYEDDHAAADFTLPGIALQRVFDWIRLLSGLPFRQVILEYQNGAPDCIHISARSGGNDKRQALIGQTHNASAYTVAEVA